MSLLSKIKSFFTFAADMWRMLTTPKIPFERAKSRVLAHLAVHGPSLTNELATLFEPEDLFHPEPYKHLMLAELFQYLIRMEEDGSIVSQQIAVEGRKRLLWSLKKPA